MAWQAICGGANGVFFFAFWDFLRNPDVPFATEWGRLSAIASEIDRFAPVLLSSAAPAPTVTLGGNKLGKQVGWLATRSHWAPAAGYSSNHHSNHGETRELYIFAVNNGNGDGPVDFVLGGNHSMVVGGDVRVISESPVRLIEAGQRRRGFSDTIQRLDVLVYQIVVAGTDAPMGDD